MYITLYLYVHTDNHNHINYPWILLVLPCLKNNLYNAEGQ